MSRVWKKKLAEKSSYKRRVSRPRLLATDWVQWQGAFLCFDFDCDPGLELHGEVVGEDSDLLYKRVMLKLEKESNSRNVSVIKDALGHNVVMINDIIFRGKRGIKWIDVEEYLRQYVGEFYTIAETNEVVYIGTDLPDEYAHSEYTHILKGANEKAKANAAQGLPELIITATNMEHTDNSKAKHKKDAKYGWYKYESRFALPVFAGDGEVERYNVFHVAMILSHDKDSIMPVGIRILVLMPAGFFTFILQKHDV